MCKTISFPTWSDGSPVLPGQWALSNCGPLRIHSVEVDEVGYTLWARVPNTGGFHRRYIIDQGTAKSHPVRLGEYCDFWGPDISVPEVSVYELTPIEMPTNDAQALWM